MNACIWLGSYEMGRHKESKLFKENDSRSMKQVGQLQSLAQLWGSACRRLIE